MSDRPESHKRGYYGLVLVVGVGLSVAGNSLHAHAVTGGSALAAVGAAIFPVLLLMMTELMMLTAKRFGGWVRAVTAGLAAVVAAISFAISYEALAYVARELFGIGATLAWAVPLTVDLPIIGATLALWAASDLIRQARVASSETEIPSMVLTTAADDKPVVAVSDGDSAMYAPVDDSRFPSTTTVDQAVSEVVDDDAELLTTAVDDTNTLSTIVVTAPVVDELAQVNTANDSRPPVDDCDAEPVDDSDSSPSTTDDDDAQFVDGNPVVDSDDRHPVAPVTADNAVVVDNATSSTIVDTDRITALATAVVDETRTKVSVDDVARVLVMRGEGMSMTAIADTVGIASHSTVSGLVKAAARIDDAYAVAVDQQRRPALAAVRG
ncbi:DUF2637 domain-containing protein [Gordonia sp. 852002-10350_SCH5691597]|uniref:DUF2637 domain-containing protein n=1 Tax=Gordonia sp. 852002-10350_SCH5691597 TaxID=1834085 RepID=UPI0007EA3C7E|nr:DUF2637 domain-containing protein [Gordonia sp. 852002-10350_SCH5691597]OBA67742.1 hypothetical protein A5777_16655 [Gordonia sp. 852002-10350_SCH5691597]